MILFSPSVRQQKLSDMSEIYFIRHGQASFGKADYDILSPSGERQSEILAKYLSGTGIQFDAIYCGQMKRHIDTASPMIRFYEKNNIPIPSFTFVKEFDEYNAGALIAARLKQDMAEGTDTKAKTVDFDDIRKDKKAFQTFFAETVYQWVEGGYDHMDGIESYPDFCNRVGRGLERIIRDNGRGKRLAVFTSGGPISVVVKDALELSGNKAMNLSWQIMNASITCLKYSGNRSVLWGFNNASHLMLENDPSLLTYR